MVYQVLKPLYGMPHSGSFLHVTWSNWLMIILLLFLQKQNLAFAVYLFGSVLSSKRLFRGPSTNDMKK